MGNILQSPRHTPPRKHKSPKYEWIWKNLEKKSTFSPKNLIKFEQECGTQLLMVLKRGYSDKQIKNTLKFFKCGLRKDGKDQLDLSCEE